MILMINKLKSSKILQGAGVIKRRLSFESPSSQAPDSLEKRKASQTDAARSRTTAESTLQLKTPPHFRAGLQHAPTTVKNI
jgi:hypothetical protein